MILWKIFPTTRHSIHVREPVRKATLNGPKPFGYFWASKVTKNLNFVFCLPLCCLHLPINLAQIFPSQDDAGKWKKIYVIGIPPMILVHPPIPNILVQNDCSMILVLPRIPNILVQTLQNKNNLQFIEFWEPWGNQFFPLWVFLDISENIGTIWRYGLS